MFFSFSIVALDVSLDVALDVAVDMTLDVSSGEPLGMELVTFWVSSAFLPLVLGGGEITCSSVIWRNLGFLPLFF